MDVNENVFFHEALREIEERHRVTLQTAMDGFFRTDMQGRILQVNETYCRMSGYNKQELLTMKVVDIEAVHTAEMIAANIRSFAELGPKRFESRHRRKDGSLFDVEISGQYQSVASGEIVIFVRDITERKRTEEALRKSEAYLAEAQKLSHTGSWAFDLVSNKYIYLSEECYRIFELDAQEDLPTREAVSRLIHPEDWDRVNADFEKSLREKVDVSTEFRIALPSGTAKHVQVIRHPVLNSAGDVVRIVGTTIDITERKQAEDRVQHIAEALRRSEAYLAEAQRLSHTGSWAFDLASDKYVYLSEECYRIFELDPQEDLPTREAFARLIHPEDYDKVHGEYKKSLREKVDTLIEFRVALTSGAAKYIQAIQHPVLNEAGEVVELVGTTIDITERNRAEEERRQSAERFRAIADYTYDWENWIGVDGKLLWVNPAVERITGYSVGECMVMTDFPIPIVAEADRGTVARRIREAVQGSSRNDFEFRVRHKDGRLAWVAASWQPIYDSRGARLGHRSSIRDIAERKRAEEALRLAGVYTRSLIEASLDPLVTIDPEGRISDVNAATEHVTGYARSELIGTDFSDYFTEPEKARSGYREVFSEGLVRDYELNIRHRDGKITPVIYNASVYRDEAGNAIGVFAAARDITERKRAEAEINSLKNYLSNIIDSMPSMLVGMDDTRTVTQWNRQAEAFTGIPAGEAIGKPIGHLLPDFAPWIMTMGTDIDEHRPSSMEKLLIAKEGERRFYDLMLYPLLIDAVGGAVLRIEDVTERARIQELMVQTEKMMSIGGLAAGMAHEINNPLGIITQAARNIERRISLELHANRKVSEELGLNLEGIRAYFDKRQISDAIASIRTASSRAAKIVSNMLQFSRRADATVEFTSLAQIVDQALELAAGDYDLKKKYDFRSIEIIKDYQDTPQVSIVGVEIEQVILNLLKNAAQAMIANPPDRRPSITLRLRCEDRYAVLEVEDNGPGMTEDIRRRVFEPFFTTKEPGVGTGLGLSVSYMIVTQNHRGLMEAQSTPGRGTVFKVRLPIGGSKT